tara:strand:- start:4904 stop:5995 length:1092 start_codon:yes stop_codon:yes gene_type:complete
MKICFIANQLYKSGGVERTLSCRLKELGKIFDIYLITLENGNHPFYFGSIPHITHIDLNLNFDRKDNDGFKLNAINILKSKLAYLKLQSALMKIRPDYTVNVVGTHSFYFLPYVQFTGKTVLEHHASLYESLPSNFKKHRINNFDYHIFLTKEECEIADFIYKKKVVIPNPVQIKDIEVIPYFLKKNRIIAAGRIVEIKGFDRLIKAWKIIYKDFPDWVVEIYGEPDNKVLNSLKSYINENSLEDSVHIKPSTSNITEIMNDSKIYAMTSHFESFSLVLVEAMSLGMSIVAFDCPTGPRNLINNETGSLVENNNIEAFSAALRQAMINESDSKTLASNAIKQSEYYSIDNIIGQWKSFFKNNN